MGVSSIFSIGEIVVKFCTMRIDRHKQKFDAFLFFRKFAASRRDARSVAKKPPENERSVGTQHF